ncbi:MAG: hypothetical protein ACMXYG_03305 [Candidatus Woesearchaeota archaeon]
MTKFEYEYRAFMDNDVPDIRATLDSAMKTDGLTKIVQTETDTYCVGGATDVAVRVREGQIKLKGPINAVDDLVDQYQDDRHSFPVNRQVIAEAVGIKEKKDKKLYSLDELKDYMKEKGSKTSVVDKEMTKYTGPGIEVEVSRVVIDGTQRWTVCVAGHDVQKVRETVEKYGIKGVGTKMCYAEAVRQHGL